MNNIKFLREKNNLTQEFISKIFGISQSTVAKWETGESMPRADKLPQLAEILNCSIEELFATEEEMKKSS